MSSENDYASCKPRVTGKPRVTSKRIHSKHCYRLGWTVEGSISQQSCWCQPDLQVKYRGDKLNEDFPTIPHLIHYKTSKWTRILLAKTSFTALPQICYEIRSILCITWSRSPIRKNVIVCDLVIKGRTTHLQLWFHVSVSFSTWVVDFAILIVSTEGSFVPNFWMNAIL